MTVFLTFQMVILWYNMSVCFLLKQTKEEKMTKEQEFEAWVNTQIMVNEMAVEESRRVLEEDKDERAADAYIRYESKLDAYRFIQGKFANYHADKGFHDLPDELLGQRHY